MTESFTLALAQMNPTVGDLAGNAKLMEEAAREASRQGADLVLFPEMSMTGYPPEDLILVPSFRWQAMRAAEELAKATKDLNCDLLFGNLWHDGERTYNASLLASGGTLTPVRTKYTLPNYGVFDEQRWFDPGKAPEVLHWRGIRLGVLICEEVWDDSLPPMLKEQRAEIVLVQNASPYHLGKARERKVVVTQAAAVTQAPVVYLNLWGGQDELVFDGRSYAVDPAGNDVAKLPAFTGALAMLKWEKGKDGWRCVSAPMEETRPNEENVYQALVTGLRDYVGKNGFPGVVLGLSGGIDSAFTAAIAADALGASRVRGLRLPSPYTSAESLHDAEETAKLLSIALDTVPIAPLMQVAANTLAPVFHGREDDATEENIQARLRGLLLMAVSNKFGPMLLTTGNKSELSVGYATLYGDMCGGFNVLKDMYKTTVYKLAQWRNGLGAADKERLGFHGPAGMSVPAHTLVKPPTAELKPNQFDQDTLPPYEELDMILRGLIERQMSIHELAEEGMDRALVEKVARMLGAAEYKRRQSPPGVKITPMAFGRDRRWPITNRWKFQ